MGDQGMTERTQAPRASDFMTEHVCTVTPEMALVDIITLLLKHGTSNAPVIETRDGKRRLVGFISERDCLGFLANELFFGTPSPSQTAATIMRRHPVCVGPETDLFALASIFAGHGYRHLPVVENEELLGIVSRRDILRAMDAYYREVLAASEFARNPPDLHEIVNQRFIVSR
jgi:CBS domain-containing protein